jgi:hypothetical protein
MTAYGDFHDCTCCPLCGSAERISAPNAEPNLYSEKLAQLLSIPEHELLRAISNVACQHCGLIYKARFFDDSVLTQLYREAVPVHPKGWDVFAPRFSFKRWQVELSLLLDPDADQARAKRGLLGLLDAFDGLQAEQRQQLKRAIEAADLALLRRQEFAIAECFTRPPRAFKRFSGFSSESLWQLLEAKLGAIERYGELGCPLWGQLRRAGLRETVLFERAEANFWGAACVQDGRSCVRAISACSSLKHHDFSQVLAQPLELLSVIHYLDHVRSPLALLSTALRQARAVLIVLDAGEQALAIQHRTGWPKSAFDYVAHRLGVLLDDAFELFEGSGSEAKLLSVAS